MRNRKTQVEIVAAFVIDKALARASSTSFTTTKKAQEKISSFLTAETFVICHANSVIVSGTLLVDVSKACILETLTTDVTTGFIVITVEERVERVGNEPMVEVVIVAFVLVHDSKDEVLFVNLEPVD